MLLGQFRHSMDAKGRVHLPARWRKDLKAGLVLAQGFERCVAVYPAAFFEELANGLHELPATKSVNREYARLLFSSASEEQLDSQGRIVVPSNLKEWAGLTKDVVLAGVQRRGEIWDAAAWETYQSSKQKRYEEIAEQLDL